MVLGEVGDDRADISNRSHQIDFVWVEAGKRLVGFHRVVELAQDTTVVDDQPVFFPREQSIHARNRLQDIVAFE